MRDHMSRRFSANRRRTNAAARAEVGDGNIPITVVEICYRAMKIEVPCDIPSGSGITIQIMDEEIPAIVHWCQSNIAGVHLLANPKAATLRMIEAAEDEFAAYR